MPKMTKRWRNLAIALAILGFAAFAIQLGLHPSVFVPGDTSCPSAALNGGCFRAVPVDAGATLVRGVLNGAIWFGLVYLVFLVVYALRRATTRSRAKGEAPPKSDE